MDGEVMTFCGLWPIAPGTHALAVVRICFPIRCTGWSGSLRRQVNTEVSEMGCVPELSLIKGRRGAPHMDERQRKWDKRLKLFDDRSPTAD